MHVNIAIQKGKLMMKFKHNNNLDKWKQII